MSDLLRTIAFAFRRKGADAMDGAQLRLLLAYDLRWFAPEDAKRVVARAIEVGLLHAEGDILRPAFDARAVDIPVNFRPGPAVLEEEAPALPRAPVATPARAAPTEHERAAEEERRRRGLLVSIEVARLIVRRRAGDAVADEAAAMEAALLSAGAPPRPGAP